MNVVVLVLWLMGSWLAEQEVQGSFPGLAATISEIGCLMSQYGWNITKAK